MNVQSVGDASSRLVSWTNTLTTGYWAFLGIDTTSKAPGKNTLFAETGEKKHGCKKSGDILQQNCALENEVHGKQTLEHAFQDITGWYEVVEENSSFENICEDFKIDDLNEVHREFSVVNKANGEIVIKDGAKIRHERCVLIIRGLRTLLII